MAIVDTGTVNVINPQVDQTVRVFDQFYRYEANIPAQEYDIVYSYFRSVFTTDLAAANFTSSVFQVADETNIPALELLQSFQGKNEMQLSVTMAYYLNSIRSPSTLLGVLMPTVPNYYTSRNVKA